MRSGKPIWLGISAMASFGLYFLLSLRYPLASSLDNPRATWATMIAPTGWNAALHLAIYLGLTLLYLVMLRLLAARHGGSAVRSRQYVMVILTAWLACSAALMFAGPGGESHDIFDYIFRGRMMTEYQANPLVETPSGLDVSPPFSHYLAWHKNVDTYGPVWEASSAAIAISVRQAARWLGLWDKAFPVCPAAPDSCRLLMLYISGYRLFAILLTGASGWLIFSLVGRNQQSLAPLALAVWLLNPMTLTASALGGHNDAVLLVLFLCCLLFLQRDRLFLALMALVLAVHVKLTALIWLPVCALWIVSRWGWRRALKVGLASAISGLALSWVLYAPFGGWQTLPGMLDERTEFLANSPWRLLQYILVHREGWLDDRARKLSVGLPGWLFAVGALFLPLWKFNLRPSCWRFPTLRPVATDRKLWGTLIAVSVLYLLVGSFWFQHWYMLLALAPAALLPESRFTRSILPWLIFGALSANLAMDFLFATVLKAPPTMMRYLLPVLMIWTPGIIALGLSFWRGGRRLRHTPGAGVSV